MVKTDPKAEIRRAADMLVSDGNGFACGKKYGSVTVTIEFEGGIPLRIRRIPHEVIKTDSG